MLVVLQALAFLEIGDGAWRSDLADTGKVWEGMVMEEESNALWGSEQT